MRTEQWNHRELIENGRDWLSRIKTFQYAFYGLVISIFGTHEILVVVMTGGTVKAARRFIVTEKDYLKCVEHCKMEKTA